MGDEGTQLTRVAPLGQHSLLALSAVSATNARELTAR